MKLTDITVLVAVDADYLDKFMAVYRTWLRFKPEINQMPMVIMVDDALVGPRDPNATAEDVIGHALETPIGRSLLSIQMARAIRGSLEAGNASRFPPIDVVPWAMPEAETQREKMLTSLVWGAAEHVKTPWYLKIDADAVATRSCEWIKDSWFLPDRTGREPVFITNSWGYTKPATFLDSLDEWAETVPELASGRKLPRTLSDDKTRAYHKRIISWLFFGNTAWTKEVVALLKTKKLPVPSQDTFLHYCAYRMEKHCVTDRMKKLGWDHLGRRRLSRIVSECERLMA